VPELQANGLRFHVQVLGEDRPRGAHLRRHPAARPTVVMIHDLVTDNLSSYYYTIANPVGMVADTHLYDLRGHGRSEVPASGYRVSDHVNDLARLLHAWDIHEPVHVVGNSFGGVVALTFADRYPQRVASLILLDAHFSIDGWGDHLVSSLTLAAFGVRSSRKVENMARHAERLLGETSLIADLEGERPFPSAGLRQLAAPVLAIYGDESDILDRAHALETHLPDCELHIVPESSQSVLFEATPYVREQMLVWLDRMRDRVATPSSDTPVNRRADHPGPTTSP
jgi:pimeloyl-ACP methyl ester carboxylesterase